MTANIRPDLKNIEIILEKILNEIDVGVHVVDSDGKTIIYNQKMRSIEGMEIEDVLDKTLLEVFSFNTNEDSTLLEALRKGMTIKNAKQTYFNNKGQEITTVNHTFPIEVKGEKIGAMEIARDITKVERLLRENFLQKAATKYTFESINGSSPEISEIIESSRRAARTNSSVLIIGETGTGKELFAQSIHNGSSRSAKPFISQNCAALPDTLIEGLLFGTKKGAFTGAIERPGLFEQAERGTLLLDEINSLNPQLQAKLLRAIQEKTIRRVGDTKDREVDVRILATMNEDPIEAIANGTLRKDLFYRLSVVSLFIPPLRERRMDIRELVYFFIEKYNHLFGMDVKKVEEDVLAKLTDYDWPGNVRELEHLIEGTMNLLEHEEAITFSHLPLHYQNKPHFKKHAATKRELEEMLIQKGRDIKSLDEYMLEAEIYYLRKVLLHHAFNITKAAKALNMSRQNLQYRMRKYGIRKE